MEMVIVMANYNKKTEPSEYLKTALAVSAALVIFLASACYIICKTLSARRHYERWKDYEECGLS